MSPEMRPKSFGTFEKRAQGSDELLVHSQERDQGDNIMAEDEDIELLKRHEQEKLEALKEEEILQKDELEAVSDILTTNKPDDLYVFPPLQNGLLFSFQVREEMLDERSKRLKANHVKLGEIIAQLQIEKAKQVFFHFLLTFLYIETD